VSGRPRAGAPGKTHDTPPMGSIETTPLPAVHHIRHDPRKEPRSALELPVVVSDASNRVEGGIRFDPADVSTGGAFLRADLLFEVGEVLTLQFQIPGAGRHIRAAGRVVRVSREVSKDQVPGMGVEFVDLSPDDRAAIEAGLAK
jgi:uncharacterized protein (TIGR02266 family)